jgi:ferredoxin-fold anticodon binding domain-containing protein
MKKRLAKAKAKLVDAKLASEKQLTANIKEKEDEVKRAEAELAAAEAGIPDVILGLIKKLPWVVVVGFIFIYLGLTIIGAALPIKIRVG